MTRFLKAGPLAALMCLAAAPSKGATGPSIKAAQEDENTIRVVVPGTFETTFTHREGGAA